MITYIPNHLLTIFEWINDKNQCRVDLSTWQRLVLLVFLPNSSSSSTSTKSMGSGIWINVQSSAQIWIQIEHSYLTWFTLVVQKSSITLNHRAVIWNLDHLRLVLFEMRNYSKNMKWQFYHYELGKSTHTLSQTTISLSISSKTTIVFISS